MSEGDAVKRLRIEYAGMVLFDSQVDEFSWTDSPVGVTAAGKFKSADKGTAGVAEFLGALSGKSKPSVDERRVAYEAEKAAKEKES